MPTSSAEQIRVLLDRPRGRGMVMSCYADTSVAEGHRRHWRQHLEKESRRAREALAGDPARLREFDEKAEAVRRALESPQARRWRGLAIFVGPGDEVVAIPGADPFPSRLVLDEAPDLIPLLEAEWRRREYLVVETDTHRGRLFAACPGQSRVLAEFDEAIPRKQWSAGERWGWGRDRIARHREELIARYWDALALEVERAWEARPYRGILLVGEREVLAGFRRRLPAQLASRVAREVSHFWDNASSSVVEIVRAIAAAEIRDEAEALLTEAAGRDRQGFALAAGPQEVLVALRDGQVADVLLGPDPGESASRCEGCGSAFVAPHESCPYCGSACDRVNLWQEIATVAIRHGVAVHFAGDDPRLARLGGVAALLARDEPQWAVGAASGRRPSV